MAECKCRQANAILGFHLALLRPSSPAGLEAARIIDLVRHLPCTQATFSRVECALAKALAVVRDYNGNGPVPGSVYVCGGIGRKGELLLAVTHQGASCGRGGRGPVTCPVNAWQAEVADFLFSRQLVDRVEFSLNGRQLVLAWRRQPAKAAMGLARSGAVSVNAPSMVCDLKP